jgi:hypothetical protein
VLNVNKHETLDLQGFGHTGMAKLTQVINILSTWGYIAVSKIKTRPDPCLKITVKRSDDFQKKFDDFAKVLEERREERARLQEQKKAEAEEAKAADSAKAATDEADAAKAATEEADAEAIPAATDDKVEPKADEEEQTKA